MMLDFALSEEHGVVRIRLTADDVTWSDAPLVNRLRVVTADGEQLHTRLTAVAVDANRVSGTLGGLAVTRTYTRVNSDTLAEHISLRNAGSVPIRAVSCLFGIQQQLTTLEGREVDLSANDRWTAIPFRHAPWDDAIQEWSCAGLLADPGRERRLSPEQKMRLLPGDQHLAEGFAWQRDHACLGVFTGNDTRVQFGALAAWSQDEGAFMGIGTGLPRLGEPGVPTVIEPGETLELGVVRYVAIAGDSEQAMLAYRAWLDERGYRFPNDYNPPLQWNELYDNPEWGATRCRQNRDSFLSRDTRKVTYTLASMEEEATKARAHGCEALYLDPGWDTIFGSFIWDADRLGPLDTFVQQMRANYGLEVCLHCPVAPWMSFSGRAAAAWPAEAVRLGPDGQPIPSGRICLASPHYLDTAAARLLSLCEQGIRFIMLDGTFWIGACHNPNHGHTVPSTFDDHVAANYELARRVKAHFPNVLIELHDPLTGGARPRWLPTYFGYDPASCYDENWGFELMWDPFTDLSSGRALALYDYALSCNVPIYLHIDLHSDNMHATAFWWYASTCRHLGIGGTHEDPNVVTVHRHAATRYRRLERFFKVGAFYGINEAIHLHVLADENAVVINVFNLSDEPRKVTGSIPLQAIGLDPEPWYTRSSSRAGLTGDPAALTVFSNLPPWGNSVIEMRAVPSV